MSWVGLIRTVSLPLGLKLGLDLPVSLYLCLSLFCTHWLTHPHSCQTRQLCQQLFPRKSPMRGRVKQHANGQTLQTLIEAISRVFISAVVALVWNLPKDEVQGAASLSFFHNMITKRSSLSLLKYCLFTLITGAVQHMISGLMPLFSCVV